MRIINNKKGSALLWCVLLSVIITILLGAIITSVVAYYNYTMFTIKRQQAYFTARSAMDAIITQVSNQSPGDPNYIALPDTKSHGELSLSDFAFYTTDDSNASKEITNMGEIKEASITGSYKDHIDQYIIKVVAEYAGQEYMITSTIAKTPIYFSGIAIKNLTYKPIKTITGTSNSSTFKLGKKTDLYWNNTDNFYSQKSFENGTLTFELYGNLVTKGDAYIYSGNTIAGKQFTKNVKFTKNGSFSKYIWNSEQYLLSNTTLKVADDSSTDYNDSTFKKLQNITNTTRQYCNNNKQTADMSPGGDFGSPYSAIDRITDTVNSSIRGLADSKHTTSLIGGALANMVSGVVDEVERLASDYAFDSNALTNTSNDGLSVYYIRFLSLSNALLSNTTTIKNNWLTGSFNAVMSWFIQTLTGDSNFNMVDYMAGLIDQIGYTVMDISYVGYDSTKSNNWSDNVVPVVYMVVDNGLTVRVQTGSEPGKQSISGRLIDRVDNMADRLISTAFGKNNTAYVIVYLDAAEGGKDDQVTTIELGCPVKRPANVDEGDLVFNYSIYGGKNSRVILNDGVTVLGEIICDNLELRGDVNLVYTNSNGSQVAKQKVDEFWSVVNYSDSDKTADKVAS